MLSWYKWPILCIVAELRMEIWTLGCQEWGWYRQNCFSRATVFYIFMKSKWKNVWFFWVVKEKNRKIPNPQWLHQNPWIYWTGAGIVMALWWKEGTLDRVTAWFPIWDLSPAGYVTLDKLLNLSVPPWWYED